MTELPAPQTDLGEWGLEPEQQRVFEFLRDTILATEPGLAPVFLHADGTLRVVFAYGWISGELRAMRPPAPPEEEPTT